MEEAGRFSKAGLGEAAFKAETDGQLRLLVHCPGCPPFLVVTAGTKTIGDLQREIVGQHRELFSGGDIPAIKIRWLEDSQRHALAASSCCSAVLADREKIFACSVLDPLREGVFEQPGQTGSALELVSHWRNTCIDTAARLSALSQVKFDRRHMSISSTASRIQFLKCMYDIHCLLKKGCFIIIINRVGGRKRCLKPGACKCC